VGLLMTGFDHLASVLIIIFSLFLFANVFCIVSSFCISRTGEFGRVWIGYSSLWPYFGSIVFYDLVAFSLFVLYYVYELMN
jgi:hypothetical protein